jgi:hypothetical protein
MQRPRLPDVCVPRVWVHTHHRPLLRSDRRERSVRPPGVRPGLDPRGLRRLLVLPARARANQPSEWAQRRAGAAQQGPVDRAAQERACLLGARGVLAAGRPSKRGLEQFLTGFLFFF